MIETTGKAANGLHSADIYFPQTEPFASNPENKRFVAQMQKQFKTERTSSWRSAPPRSRSGPRRR